MRCNAYLPAARPVDKGGATPDTAWVFADAVACPRCGHQMLAIELRLVTDQMFMSGGERVFDRLAALNEPFSWWGLRQPRVTVSDTDALLLHESNRRPAVRCGRCRVTVVAP